MKTINSQGGSNPQTQNRTVKSSINTRKKTAIAASIEQVSETKNRVQEPSKQAAASKRTTRQTTTQMKKKKPSSTNNNKDQSSSKVNPVQEPDANEQVDQLLTISEKQTMTVSASFNNTASCAVEQSSNHPADVTTASSVKESPNIKQVLKNHCQLVDSNIEFAKENVEEKPRQTRASISASRETHQKLNNQVEDCESQREKLNQQEVDVQELQCTNEEINNQNSVKDKTGSSINPSNDQLPVITESNMKPETDLIQDAQSCNQINGNNSASQSSRPAYQQATTHQLSQSVSHIGFNSSVIRNDANGNNNSIMSLEPHPFNTIISEFQQKKQSKQGSVQQFFDTFQEEMDRQEKMYQAQKQLMDEEVRMSQTIQMDASTDQQTNATNQPWDLQANDQAYSNTNYQMIKQKEAFPVSQFPVSSNLFQSSALNCQSSAEMTESFQFTPNSLHVFYPKQVQKNILRRKFQNTNRIVQGLKAPPTKFKQTKTLKKMNLLASCQMNFIQVVMQKINRKSKPIKKREKLVHESLRKKKIYLEEENFDILGILKNSTKQNQNQLSSRIAPATLNARAIATSGSLGLNLLPLAKPSMSLLNAGSGSNLTAANIQQHQQLTIQDNSPQPVIVDEEMKDEQSKKNELNKKPLLSQSSVVNSDHPKAKQSSKNGNKAIKDTGASIHVSLEEELKTSQGVVSIQQNKKGQTNQLAPLNVVDELLDNSIDGSLPMAERSSNNQSKSGMHEPSSVAQIVKMAVNQTEIGESLLKPSSENTSPAPDKIFGAVSDKPDQITDQPNLKRTSSTTKQQQLHLKKTQSNTSTKKRGSKQNRDQVQQNQTSTTIANATARNTSSLALGADGEVSVDTQMRDASVSESNVAATPKTDLKRQKSTTSKQKRTKNGGKPGKQGNSGCDTTGADGSNANNQPLIETYEKENGNFTMKIHMNVYDKCDGTVQSKQQQLRHYQSDYFNQKIHSGIADGGCQRTNLTTAETGAPDVDHHANIQLPYENQIVYANSHINHGMQIDQHQAEPNHQHHVSFVDHHNHQLDPHAHHHHHSHLVVDPKQAHHHPHGSEDQYMIDDVIMQQQQTSQHNQHCIYDSINHVVPDGHHHHVPYNLHKSHSVSVPQHYDADVNQNDPGKDGLYLQHAHSYNGVPTGGPHAACSTHHDRFHVPEMYDHGHKQGQCLAQSHKMIQFDHPHHNDFEIFYNPATGAHGGHNQNSSSEPAQNTQRHQTASPTASNVANPYHAAKMQHFQQNSHQNDIIPPAVGDGTPQASSKNHSGGQTHHHQAQATPLQASMTKREPHAHHPLLISANVDQQFASPATGYFGAAPQLASQTSHHMNHQHHNTNTGGYHHLFSSGGFHHHHMHVHPNHDHIGNSHHHNHGSLYKIEDPQTSDLKVDHHHHHNQQLSYGNHVHNHHQHNHLLEETPQIHEWSAANLIDEFQPHDAPQQAQHHGASRSNEFCLEPQPVSSSSDHAAV